MSSPRKAFLPALLQQLTIPDVSTAIAGCTGSRLFDDAPRTFDCIYVNLKQDQAALVFILKNILGRDILITDEQIQFIYHGHIDCIKRWAKKILFHAETQLLDKYKSIRPEILPLLGAGNQRMTGRELLCAFFAANCQSIIVAISQCGDMQKINPNVFKAFTLLTNKYPEWVDEVIFHHYYRNMFFNASIVALTKTASALTYLADTLDSELEIEDFIPKND